MSASYVSKVIFAQAREDEQRERNVRLPSQRISWTVNQNQFVEAKSVCADSLEVKKEEMLRQCTRTAWNIQQKHNANNVGNLLYKLDGNAGICDGWIIEIRVDLQ